MVLPKKNVSYSYCLAISSSTCDMYFRIYDFFIFFNFCDFNSDFKSLSPCLLANSSVYSTVGSVCNGSSMVKKGCSESCVAVGLALGSDLKHCFKRSCNASFSLKILHSSLLVLNISLNGFSP